MKIKYNIGEKVTVILPKISGIIVAIYITLDQIQYYVRYYSGNDAKLTYFFDFELESESEHSLGFMVSKPLRSAISVLTA